MHAVTHGGAASEEDHASVMGTQTVDEQQREVTVLVVDDHPALRAGLSGLLSAEPGMTCVGALSGTAGLTDAVRDTRPDVVVLDYALGLDDGLSACFRLKQWHDAPAVVLYSAYVDGPFTVPAAMAQADALVAKSAEAGELLATIRGVAAGSTERHRPDPELIEAASARLTAGDLPVAGMLLGATPVSDIAQTLDLPESDVRRTALRIIGRLQAGHRLRPRPCVRDWEGLP